MEMSTRIFQAEYDRAGISSHPTTQPGIRSLTPQPFVTF
jgi:hypothetical protein